MRFATEWHSLTVVRSSGKHRTLRGGDDYSIFVDRLPSTTLSEVRSKRNEEKSKKSNTNGPGNTANTTTAAPTGSNTVSSKPAPEEERGDNNSAICLAHSSLHFECDDYFNNGHARQSNHHDHGTATANNTAATTFPPNPSMEVFAMMRLSSAETIASRNASSDTTTVGSATNNNEHQKSASAAASSTGAGGAAGFVDNNSQDGGGGDHHSVDASSVAAAVKGGTDAASSTDANNNTSNNNNTNNNNNNNNNNIDPNSKNEEHYCYYLTIKSRLLVERRHGSSRGKHEGKQQQQQQHLEKKNIENEPIEKEKEEEDDDDDGGAINSDGAVLGNTSSSEHYCPTTTTPSPTTATPSLRLTSMMETIKLDFRPMLIHITELDVPIINDEKKQRIIIRKRRRRRRNDQTNKKQSSSSSSSAIGIFVASADDNKLRFYVATKQCLQARCCSRSSSTTNTTTTASSNEMVEPTATTAAAADAAHSSSSCFVPVLLSEAVVRQSDGNSFTSSLHTQQQQQQQQQQQHNDGSEYHILNDPFVFPTPIMALDACISTKASNSTQCLTNENRLAVACYDGTIRIFTYQLKFENPDSDGDTDEEDEFVNQDDDDDDYDDDDDEEEEMTSDEIMSADLTTSLKICNLRYSTFIVDGPVVTLHFGKSMFPDFHAPTTGEECDPMPLALTPHVFLVAGSLCGFACLFYEVPAAAPPRTKNNGSMDDNGPLLQSDDDGSPYFHGPLAIVDGLYDAQGEGYEDCVTSVHACHQDEKQSMIAVGTQGGRVLLFRPVISVREQWDKVREKMQSNKKKLLLRIDGNKATIEQLQFEREAMGSKAASLNGSIAEMQGIIENMILTSETTTSGPENGDSVLDAETENAITGTQSDIASTEVENLAMDVNKISFVDVEDFADFQDHAKISAENTENSSDGNGDSSAQLLRSQNDQSLPPGENLESAEATYNNTSAQALAFENTPCPSADTDLSKPDDKLESLGEDADTPHDSLALQIGDFELAMIEEENDDSELREMETKRLEENVPPLSSSALPEIIGMAEDDVELKSHEEEANMKRDSLVNELELAIIEEETTNSELNELGQTIHLDKKQPPLTEEIKSAKTDIEPSPSSTQIPVELNNDGDSNEPSELDKPSFASSKISQKISNDKSILITKIKTKVELAKAELSKIEKDAANHSSAIAELESTVVDLVNRCSEMASSSSTKTNAIISSIRKLHRFEFLWEHRFPYPIHGITYCNDWRGQQHEQPQSDLFISTRRSFHVFRSVHADCTM